MAGRRSMASPRPFSPSGRYGPILFFIGTSLLGGLIVRYCYDRFGRYASPEPGHELGAPNKILVFIWAELLILAPFCVVYWVFFLTYAEHARRRIWMAGGAIAGLALSLFVDNPHIQMGDDATFNVKTIATALVMAVTPQSHLGWVVVLTHAGALAAVFLTRTEFAQRLDLDLPQDGVYGRYLPRTHCGGRPTLETRRPSTITPSILGMTWVTAVWLTRLDDDYISYFSKDPSQRTMLDHWLFGVTQAFLLSLYSCAAYYFIGSTRMLPWYFFCWILTGAVCGTAFKLQDGGAEWQTQLHDVGIVFFIMHLAVNVSIPTRFSSAAHMFYRIIGVQHPETTMWLQDIESEAKWAQVVLMDEKDAYEIRRNSV